MELLTSLPADLAAIADPSARGPAPLLRPPDADGMPAAPFELCLALLTAPSAGGEAWPVAGKELPVLPLDPATETEGATELAANGLPEFAAAALAERALPTWLRLAATPQPGLPAAATTVASPLPPTQSGIVPPPLPSGELPTPDSLAPPASAPLDSLDPLALLAAAEAQLEVAETRAPSTSAKTAPAPSWLEAFSAHERRVQRPLAATPTELRAAAAPPPPTVSPPIVANQPTAATTAAVADPTWASQGVVRRVELPKILASAMTAAESSSASPADRLPPAGAHGTATSAVAALAATVPGAPVDLRSPSWQETFAHRVQVLVDTQVGEARIKLNPPELGAVDVKISLVDDKTYVQLTTATAAARDELAQSLPRLRELFTVSGLELGGASVHNGRDGQQGGHGDGADRATANASPFASFAADHDVPPPVPRRALGRIDVFA